MELGLLGATNISINFNLLHPMLDSIKQQNTFTTIAVANVEVVANYHGHCEWF